MAEQLQNSSGGELCRNCHRFFGSPQSNFLCSQCFKQVQQTLPVNRSDPPPSATASLNPSLAEEAKESAPKQPDRCGKCSKRVGLTCFPCKCGETFCINCRQPEVHLCAFDHRAQGIRKLSESNPVVTAEKVNRF